MNVILIAVISLGVIALVSAAILTWLPRNSPCMKIADCPGSRGASPGKLRGCGYPGCSGFADACVKAGSLDGKLVRWVDSPS